MLGNTEEPRRSWSISGPSALPDLEASINSLAEQGDRAEIAPAYPWLFYAYAKIRGRDAYPMLHAIVNRRPTAISSNVDDISMAIALGLTSTVDPGRTARPAACRPAEPRDVLDRMVLAWEKGDRAQFESTLGPNAARSLKSLLKNTSWEKLRAKFWPSVADPHLVIGYHLNVPGHGQCPTKTWMQPATPRWSRKCP